MKIAVLYNRDSQNVINLFGAPNREKIGLKLIQRITSDLEAGGHTAVSFEADKDLIDRLEEFMPRVVKGERPGLVFNLSYGIQGQARYTHVPSILEMMGMPYLGSGPLAHSIALDKVITKMVLVQHGLPTPAFAVLERPDFEAPELPYPVIVKPKHEAVSFGIRVCNDVDELREAAGLIFEMLGEAVLVELFVEGREVNVGLLGNSPAEALPPVELVFGSTGPTVYSYEDKTGKSGRKIELACPAPLGEELTAHAQDLAQRAFAAVGCCDCARVDMRLDEKGDLYILEINSLPSLGPRGSYVRAAETAGLDFGALVNRLVEVASARYFGTPRPRLVGRSDDPSAAILDHVTQRRDRIEKRIAQWVGHGSRTSDPIGLQDIARQLDELLRELGLRSLETLSDPRSVRSWETEAGLDGGTLLVAHLDVPVGDSVPAMGYRRGPELLHGEGVGTSRAPLVELEFALRALRNVRALRKRKLGVSLYLDEGRDAQYSREFLTRAMARSAHVLVLRPGGADNSFFVERRGLRKLRLEVEGEPVRIGRPGRRTPVLNWLSQKIPEMTSLGSKSTRLAVQIAEIHTRSFPMRVPHRVSAEIYVSYADAESAARAVARVRKTLGRGGPKWRLETLSDRPPLGPRPESRALADRLLETAHAWDIPLHSDGSSWPSAAGLAPEGVAVLCGLGPVAQGLNTPDEAVQRLSVVQRTLLLAQFLHQGAA
ncbi:MAG TPA: ATP-grasp domain-containing protein [Thermoanaerobaculia bacterium]|nr:ATP-grasp domain-containing protein [Thermoanaerobaculia bacterium]